MATHIPPHTARSPARSPRPISAQSTIRQVTPSPETLRQQPAAANPQLMPSGRRPGHKRSTHHVDPLTVFPLPPSSATSPASRIPQPTFSTGQNNRLKRSNAVRISPNTPKDAARSTHGPAQRQHRVLTPSGLERGRVEYYGSASAAHAARRPREQPPQQHHTGPTISASSPSPSHQQQIVQVPPDDDPFTPTAGPSSRPPQQFWLVQSPAPLPAEQQHAVNTTDQITPTRGRAAAAAASSSLPSSSASTTMQTAATRQQPTIFSTPGRDEMERKNGRLQPFSVRDGPFTGVRGVEELQRARREVEREEEEREGKGCCGGCKCVVM